MIMLGPEEWDQSRTPPAANMIMIGLSHAR